LHILSYFPTQDIILIFTFFGRVKIKKNISQKKIWDWEIRNDSIPLG